ncbi:MAG TPA: Lrp/AsnC family transcriptional regulator [Pararhizobium sp.]|jgi:DNA-binding Lrp family transcriptional regulator|nr:Lrp/AsnC family transcriptional regulator [Pararhizobium sp.]
MDDLDRQLIAALRIDGRAPLSKLADLIGCSRGTVQNRLDRLMESGVITGFTVRLRDDANADKVRAVMMIEVAGKVTAKVVRALRLMPEIVALHTTNGAWDLVAEIEVLSLVEFDRVLYRIRMVDGITRTDTSLLLASA